MAAPTSLPFAVVDVFSTTAYKGNPLAVVNTTSLAPSTPLSKAQQQLIARQFNLSETTFFSHPTLPNSKASYSLRSFLPDGRGVFGAGHNILGVWWYLASTEGLLDLKSEKYLVSTTKKKNGDDEEEEEREFEFWQELGGSILPVRITTTNTIKQQQQVKVKVSIRQAPPKSHAYHPDPAALAASIGLNITDIGLSPSPTSPGKPQVISTSTTKHLHVPLSSLSALNRASVQREKLLEQLALVDDHAYGLYLFAREEGENSYQARFFSPGMSGEDPATGSAAGPLALYLLEQAVLKLDAEGKGRIRVLQGLRTGRECVIDVTIERGKDGEKNGGGGGGFEVDFEGGGVEVIRGEVRIPDAGLGF